MKTKTDLHAYPKVGEMVKVVVESGLEVHVYKGHPRYDGDNNPNTTIRLEYICCDSTPYLEECKGYYQIRFKIVD